MSQETKTKVKKTTCAKRHDIERIKRNGACVLFSHPRGVRGSGLHNRDAAISLTKQWHAVPKMEKI
jgi:hypothetical protein